MKKQSITEQSKNVYDGCFFTEPKGTSKTFCPDYNINPTKIFKMAYMEGNPHVILYSWEGQGIQVDYLITGETHVWDWNKKYLAWQWAKERSAHINGIKSCYRYNYR